MSAEHRGGRPLPTGIPAMVLEGRFAPRSFFSYYFERSASVSEFKNSIGIKTNPEQDHSRKVASRRAREIENNLVKSTWGNGGFKQTFVDLTKFAQPDQV